MSFYGDILCMGFPTAVVPVVSYDTSCSEDTKHNSVDFNVRQHGFIEHNMTFNRQDLLLFVLISPSSILWSLILLCSNLKTRFVERDAMCSLLPILAAPAFHMCGIS